jgi:flagellar biosynthesis protein
MQRRYRNIKATAPEENQRLTAAAIRYDGEKDNAPEVLAGGKGKIAEKIIELGRENGIPIYDDPVLASALAEVNPGEEIPPELYTLVAHVLSFVYRTYHQATSANKRIENKNQSF